MAGYRQRGALILFEGLPPTVIDSQVLTHVRLMRQALGIDMPVIAFACTHSTFERSAKRLADARDIAGGPIFLNRGVRPAFPGSLSVNRRRLTAALRACGDIGFLHVRADYAAAVAGPLARRLKLPMLWDCRGDTVAELRQRVGAGPHLVRHLARLRVALLERDKRLAGRTCSAALFVSKPLHDLLASDIGNKPNWVVPCLALESEFFFDTDLRRKTRTSLGVADDETVFLYSGSLTSYQQFGETVELVRNVLRAGRKARFLVVTPDTAKAAPILADLPANRATFVTAGLADVNAYLNAADFGFLLRDSDAVNRVAFPTKFAEYSLAGLKVIMKADPPSCVAMARTLGTYVSLDDMARAPVLLPEERRRNAADAAQRLGRRGALPIFEQVYRSLMRGTQTP